MTIIQIEPLDTGQHPIQSQSGRNKCWLEGWIEVPRSIESAVWESGGFCELCIENGVLAGIIPGEKPEVEEPETPLDENAMLKAQVSMLQQQQTFLEECILEMADEVYA